MGGASLGYLGNALLGVLLAHFGIGLAQPAWAAQAAPAKQATAAKKDAPPVVAASASKPAPTPSPSPTPSAAPSAKPGSPAQSSSPPAKVEKLAIVSTLNREENHLPGFQWKTDHVEIESSLEGDAVKTHGKLEGTYTQKDWNLVYNSEQLALGTGKDMGRFSLSVPIEGDMTKFDLLAVGPQGEVKKQTFVIQFTAYKAHVAETHAMLKRRYQLLPGLGFTYMTYTETDVPNYSAVHLTAKVAFLFPLLPPRLDIGASAYFNVVPLTQTGSTKAARFLGLNARVGYTLTNPTSRFRFSLMGGIYYVTMFVDSNAFGFKNMMGPQVFPVVSYQLGSKDLIQLYAKFSPVSDGFFSLSFANREIAGGASFVHPLANGHNLSIMVDVSNFALALTPTGTTIKVLIGSTTASLSVGYSL